MLYVCCRHLQIRMHVHVRMQVCMYVCMYVCMRVCLYVCIYVPIQVRMHVCMHICMCMYMYVYVHVCIHVRLDLVNSYFLNLCTVYLTIWTHHAVQINEVQLYTYNKCLYFYIAIKMSIIFDVWYTGALITGRNSGIWTPPALNEPHTVPYSHLVQA